MTDIPADSLLSEESVRAGIAALERIHGHHLAGMASDEQDQARGHWRDQVQEVLAAVHGTLAAPPTEGRGRAVILFSDGEGETIDVSATFQPQLRELGPEEVEGTPAQVLALAALQQLDEGQDEPED
jgi:hypothetical protein